MSVSPPLPNTLAQRVQALREALDLTPSHLALRARMPVETLRDIEAGIETFLAPSVRSRLARALRVRPGVLQEVERFREIPQPLDFGPEAARELLEAIHDNPQRKYFCPQCGAALKVRLFDRRDLEDNPVVAVRIHCTACLFRMEQD